MHRMRDKLDLALLGAANVVGWLSNLEPFLKDILLIVSIGYAVDRWQHWRANIRRKEQHGRPD